MLFEGTTVDRAAFAAGTGWEIKPEGACRGDVCVPLPEGVDGDRIDVAAVGARLGMPIVTDEANGMSALGPATTSGRALVTADAPDLELPLVLSDDVWRLAEQRGRRTVVVAWAPW